MDHDVACLARRGRRRDAAAVRGPPHHGERVRERVVDLDENLLAFQIGHQNLELAILRVERNVV